MRYGCLNLNAAISLFIAASPRLIHHSSTEKKNTSTDLSRDQTLSVCEPSILIVVVVARVGLFTVRQIREWATYVFIYLLIFTLRYVIAPFRYLSRPLISAALALCRNALLRGSCVFLLNPVYSSIWHCPLLLTVGIVCFISAQNISFINLTGISLSEEEIWWH